MQKRANLFNEQFADVFTHDNGILPEDDHSGVKIEHTFELVCFILEADIKVINKLKRKGSAGPDNVPASFFKNASSVIAYPLSRICNASPSTLLFAIVWKKYFTN